MSDVSPPLPTFTSWPTFPFEGEIRVKQLDDPVAEEPPRHGEDPAECSACRARDSGYIWVSERWRVRALDRPTGLPMVLILESRSHLDLGDLPNLLAAELGVLTVRLERAVRSLDGVARVHVNRWGDGSAHLHVWFLARPVGRLQLRGTFLSLWDDILPRIPEDQWRANLAMVAEWLAEFGGKALAEPPRIDWQAPALLNLPAAAAQIPDDGAQLPDDGAVVETADAAQPNGADPAAANGAERVKAGERVDSGGEDGAAVWESTEAGPSAEAGPRTEAGPSAEDTAPTARADNTDGAGTAGSEGVASADTGAKGVKIVPPRDRATRSRAARKSTPQRGSEADPPPGPRRSTDDLTDSPDRLASDAKPQGKASRLGARERTGAAGDGEREAGGDAIASGLTSGR